MIIYEKLLDIQQELKAPKGQHNDYGNYNYRSCEDVQEAVKPLLKKNKAVLIMNDELELIGSRESRNILHVSGRKKLIT